MNTRDQMRRAAWMYADSVAIRHADLTRTFADSWSRGLRVANGLIEAGLRPQDRVAILDGNGPNSADAILGCTIGGFVRVPLYGRDTQERHVEMTRRAGCRALLAGPAFADVASTIADEAGVDVVVAQCDGYEDWLAAHDEVDPDPVIGEDDLYMVRFTGGTTGRPKAFAYTQRTWLNGLRDWFYAYPPMEPGDVTMHVAPISHGSGFMFVPTWLHGAVNLLVEGFDPVEVVELMERERVAFTFMVPTMAAALARVPGIRARDLGALKLFQISGAPISDATARECHAAFGDVLFQMYSLTESLTGTYMSSETWFADLPGSQPLRSAGRPSPFAEVRIVGDDGRDVPVGETGEIWLRSDAQLTEYLDDPESTAAKIVDGFVRSGDIGCFDANGLLYVVDRADDMIISGGFNIAPSELENVIAAHPGVREVAVFGVPHERWGETPLAVCVREASADVDPDEVVRRCASELGSYKKPSMVVVVDDELPRTATGKVDRKRLREPYWTGHARRVAGS